MKASTQHGAQQPQERAYRPDGGEPGDIVRRFVPSGGHLLAKHHLQGLELGGRQRPMPGALLANDAGLQLGVEGEPFPEEPVERRRRQLHRAAIGLLQPGRPIQLLEESRGLPPKPTELPALEEDEEPGREREEQDDGQDDLGLEARHQHELQHTGGNRSGGLNNRHAGKIEACRLAKNGSPRTIRS
jgi:hypothetical protein